jgi:hypothetical protein
VPAIFVYFLRFLLLLLGSTKFNDSLLFLTFAHHDSSSTLSHPQPSTLSFSVSPSYSLSEYNCPLRPSFRVWCNLLKSTSSIVVIPRCRASCRMTTTHLTKTLVLHPQTDGPTLEKRVSRIWSPMPSKTESRPRRMPRIYSRSRALQRLR